METLHQTFELIRTIVERIAQTSPDVSKSPILEEALLSLDKYSRKDGKAYRTVLPDSNLSELADFLTPFNLAFEVEDDDLPLAEPTAGPSSGVSTVRFSPEKITPSTTNAFDKMMKDASQSRSAQPNGNAAHGSTKPPKGVSAVIEVLDDSDDDFDDGFLEEVSIDDLRLMENAARSGSKGSAVASNSKSTTSIASTGPSTAPTGPRPKAPSQSHQNRPVNGRPAPTSRPAPSVAPKPPGQKLNMHVGSSASAPKKPGGSLFKSQIMRDLRQQHQADLAERSRFIGGVTPRLPAASKLGTGLGAYTGDRLKPGAPIPADSEGSSETSSEEEGGGVSALVAKQRKSPRKVSRLISERKPVRALPTAPQGSHYSDPRDRQRAEQHAMRQRLKPDLSRLYRYVLAWDPDHRGTDAPHPPQMKQELAALATVPTTFTSTDQYQQIMTPLFLQEVWAQFSQEKPKTPPIQVEVSMRSYEDEFIDIELSVQGRVPDGYYANESDILILRRVGCPSVLARVRDFKRKMRDIIFKVRVLGASDQKQLGAKMTWSLQKHMS